MRLLEAGRTAEQTADHLLSLHELGITALHSSDEYESFPLFLEALRLHRGRNPGRAFRHMVKLAEPSFNDDDRFSGHRLASRVESYRRALGVDSVDDVQWMWRRNLDHDEERQQNFAACAETIGEAVDAQKTSGRIERLLCFPYTPAFASSVLQHRWLDGLAVYRNREEREYDDALLQAAAAGKMAIVIRPFLGGKLVHDRDPATLLSDALDAPGVEAAILSTNSVAHMRALVS